MKERLKEVLKNRVFWASVGAVAGAIYPPIGQLVGIISNVILGGGLV